MKKDRRYAKVEEGREKLTAHVDVTRPEADLEILKWRLNACRLYVDDRKEMGVWKKGGGGRKREVYCCRRCRSDSGKRISDF